MKYSLAFAAAALLGSASAGVHKMKLQKIPLSEQLVRLAYLPAVYTIGLTDLISLQEHTDINSHVQALGQKYMGIRPQRHLDEMFRDTAIHTDKGHGVFVDNFLNAQCM